MYGLPAIRTEPLGCFGQTPRSQLRHANLLLVHRFFFALRGAMSEERGEETLGASSWLTRILRKHGGDLNDQIRIRIEQDFAVTHLALARRNGVSGCARHAPAVDLGRRIHLSLAWQEEGPPSAWDKRGGWGAALHYQTCPLHTLLYRE
jgi:hypothetical protein